MSIGGLGFGPAAVTGYSALDAWPHAKATDATAPKSDEAALVAARKALANANSAVDTDKANHSPGCVAFDQKLVDKAQLQLAQLQAQATQVAASGVAPAAGSVLDLTM